MAHQPYFNEKLRFLDQAQAQRKFLPHPAEVILSKDSYKHKHFLGKVAQDALSAHKQGLMG